MQTLRLDDNWDLTLDASGNIALADEPYAFAQDAASAIRTFKGEVYYDTNQGIPYWEQILGHSPPVPLMKSYFNAAAQTVPGVDKSVCYIASITNRAVTGQVQITSSSGQSAAAVFAQNLAIAQLENS